MHSVEERHNVGVDDTVDMDMTADMHPSDDADASFFKILEPSRISAMITALQKYFKNKDSILVKEDLITPFHLCGPFGTAFTDSGSHFVHQLNMLRTMNAQAETVLGRSTTGYLNHSLSKEFSFPGDVLSSLRSPDDELKKSLTSVYQMLTEQPNETSKSFIHANDVHATSSIWTKSKGGDLCVTFLNGGLGNRLMNRGIPRHRHSVYTSEKLAKIATTVSLRTTHSGITRTDKAMYAVAAVLFVTLNGNETRRRCADVFDDHSKWKLTVIQVLFNEVAGIDMPLSEDNGLTSASPNVLVKHKLRHHARMHMVLKCSQEVPTLTVCPILRQFVERWQHFVARITSPYAVTQILSKRLVWHVDETGALFGKLQEQGSCSMKAIMWSSVLNTLIQHSLLSDVTNDADRAKFIDGVIMDTIQTHVVGFLHLCAYYATEDASMKISDPYAFSTVQTVGDIIHSEGWFRWKNNKELSSTYLSDDLLFAKSPDPLQRIHRVWSACVTLPEDRNRSPTAVTNERQIVNSSGSKATAHAVEEYSLIAVKSAANLQTCLHHLLDKTMEPMRANELLDAEVTIIRGLITSGATNHIASSDLCKLFLLGLACRTLIFAALPEDSTKPTHRSFVDRYSQGVTHQTTVERMKDISHTVNSNVIDWAWLLPVGGGVIVLDEECMMTSYSVALQSRSFDGVTWTMIKIVFNMYRDLEDATPQALSFGVKSNLFDMNKLGKNPCTSLTLAVGLAYCNHMFATRSPYSSGVDMMDDHSAGLEATYLPFAVAKSMLYALQHGNVSQFAQCDSFDTLVEKDEYDNMINKNAYVVKLMSTMLRIVPAIHLRSVVWDLYASCPSMFRVLFHLAHETDNFPYRLVDSGNVNWFDVLVTQKVIGSVSKPNSFEYVRVNDKQARVFFEFRLVCDTFEEWISKVHEHIMNSQMQHYPPMQSIRHSGSGMYRSPFTHMLYDRYKVVFARQRLAKAVGHRIFHSSTDLLLNLQDTRNEKWCIVSESFGSCAELVFDKRTGKLQSMTLDGHAINIHPSLLTTPGLRSMPWNATFWFPTMHPDSKSLSGVLFYLPPVDTLKDAFVKTPFGNFTLEQHSQNKAMFFPAPRYSEWIPYVVPNQKVFAWLFGADPCLQQMMMPTRDRAGVFSELKMHHPSAEVRAIEVRHLHTIMNRVIRDDISEFRLSSTEMLEEMLFELKRVVKFENVTHDDTMMKVFTRDGETPPVPDDWGTRCEFSTYLHTDRYREELDPLMTSMRDKCVHLCLYHQKKHVRGYNKSRRITSEEVFPIGSQEKTRYLCNMREIIIYDLLRQAIDEFLEARSTLSSQCEVPMDLAKTVQDILSANYKIATYTVADLMFECMFGYIIRNKQRSMVKKIQGKHDQRVIHHMVMGSGKSSVITPLLLLRNIGALNDVIVPSHLLKQTIESVRIVSWIFPHYVRVRTSEQHRRHVLDTRVKKTSLQSKWDDGYTMTYSSHIKLIDEADMLLHPMTSEMNMVMKYEERFTNHHFMYTARRVLGDDIGGPGSTDAIVEPVFDRTLTQVLQSKHYRSNINFGWMYLDKEEDGKRSGHLWVVPYLRQNTPMRESKFSNQILTVVLTLRQLRLAEFMLPKFVTRALCQSAHCIEVITSIVSEEIVSRFRNTKIVMEQKVTMIHEWQKHATLSDRTAFVFKYVDILALSSLTTGTQVANTSFLDVFVSPGDVTIGYTGTVDMVHTLNTPGLPFSITTGSRDWSEAIGIGRALKRSDDEPRMNTHDEGTFSFELMMSSIQQSWSDDMPIMCVIDAAAQFRNTRPDQFASKILSLHDDRVKFVAFVNSDFQKMVMARDKSVVPFVGVLHNTPKTFYVYTQRDIVGVDFKQPIVLHGLILLNRFCRYTDTAQAMFRLRRLNRGHTLNYLYLWSGSHGADESMRAARQLKSEQLLMILRDRDAAEKRKNAPVFQYQQFKMMMSHATGHVVDTNKVPQFLRTADKIHEFARLPPSDKALFVLKNWSILPSTDTETVRRSLVATTALTGGIDTKKLTSAIMTFVNAFADVSSPLYKYVIQTFTGTGHDANVGQTRLQVSLRTSYSSQQSQTTSLRTKISTTLSADWFPTPGVVDLPTDLSKVHAYLMKYCIPVGVFRAGTKYPVHISLSVAIKHVHRPINQLHIVQVNESTWIVRCSSYIFTEEIKYPCWTLDGRPINVSAMKEGRRLEVPLIFSCLGHQRFFFTRKMALSKNEEDAVRYTTKRLTIVDVSTTGLLFLLSVYKYYMTHLHYPSENRIFFPSSSVSNLVFERVRTMQKTWDMSELPSHGSPVFREPIRDFAPILMYGAADVHNRQTLDLYCETPAWKPARERGVARKHPRTKRPHTDVKRTPGTHVVSIGPRIPVKRARTTEHDHTDVEKTEEADTDIIMQPATEYNVLYNNRHSRRVLHPWYGALPTQHGQFVHQVAQTRSGFNGSSGSRYVWKPNAGGWHSLHE